MADLPVNGWAFPIGCRKAHVFIAGRSLCMKWGYFGPVEPDGNLGDKPGRDDCVACWRKLRDRKARIEAKKEPNTDE